jgi:hypothetical protein
MGIVPDFEPFAQNAGGSFCFFTTDDFQRKIAGHFWRSSPGWAAKDSATLVVSGRERIYGYLVWAQKDSFPCKGKKPANENKQTAQGYAKTQKNAP